MIVGFAEVKDADGKVETWTHYALSVAPDATEEAKSFAKAQGAQLANWAYRLSDSRLQRLRYTLETATKPLAEEAVEQPKG